jgi:twitching motility protein PilT
MESFFDRALAEARRLGASDVHLKPGLPPILRIAGELRRPTGPGGATPPPLTRDFLHSLAMSLLTDRRREILERTGDVTVALPTASGVRQRVHISQQRGGIGISLRLIPPEVPALDKLGLPPETRALLGPGAGLLLVAAAPGNGKTTTLAAMLADINRRHSLHIVTLEDPVEIVLPAGGGVVVQREVGLDLQSTAAGLRATARQDADVIMIGDLGDGESAELALEAAEAGRLVLAGITAPSAEVALARVAGLWDPGSRPALRARLGTALRAVLHQRLVPAPKGKGRTAEGHLLRGPEPLSPAGSAPGSSAGSAPGSSAGSAPGSAAGSAPGSAAGSAPGSAAVVEDAAPAD